MLTLDGEQRSCRQAGAFQGVGCTTTLCCSTHTHTHPYTLPLLKHVKQHGFHEKKYTQTQYGLCDRNVGQTHTHKCSTKNRNTLSSTNSVTEHTNTGCRDKYTNWDRSIKVIFCFFSGSWTCVTVLTVIYCKRLWRENTHQLSLLLSIPDLFMVHPRILFGLPGLVFSAATAVLLSTYNDLRCYLRLDCVR